MLRAGASITDITPPLGGYLQGHFNPRQSVGIHDPLHAAALVVSDGETEIALVGCDLIAMDPVVVSTAREMIARDSAIPADHVMVWATHTHAGPTMSPGHRDGRDDDYLQVLACKLAGGVKMAKDRLVNNELSVAVGHEDRISFNRRYHMRDGAVKMNPGVGNPDIVEPAGPIDPDVGCLFVTAHPDRDGSAECLDSPVVLPSPGGRGAGGEAAVASAVSATLVNFACHLDVLGSANCLISADYPYYLRRALLAAGFDAAVVLFANGACGDINHINVHASETWGGFGHCEKMGAALAGETLRRLRAPESVGEDKVKARRADIELPFRPFTEDQLAQFRAIVADDSIGERDFRKLNARSCLARGEGRVAGQTTEVQAFRIGDLGIVGIPAEYFVEFGLEIKRESPAKWTFVVELANDCVGYVPTEAAFEQGSYEGDSARFVKGAGAMLRKKALALLQELWD